MNNPPPSENSEQILALFSRLLKELDQFLTILNNEKVAIQKSDVQLIEEVSQRKSDSADAIEANSTTIEKDTGRSISEWLTDETLEGEIKTLIKQVHTQTTACHDLNMANGLSINILNNMNSFTLNLVSGKDPDMKTYGSKGQAHAAKDKNRTLGKA